MRRLTFLFVLLAVALPQVARAQYENYMELLRTDLKSERVAIFTEVLALSDSESTVFWPMYRNYENELSTMGDKRIALIKDYAAHFDSLSNAKAQELLRNTFDLQEQRLQIQEKYAKEFAKILPATSVARFFQAERFVTGLVDLQIQSELPLVKTVHDATAPKGKGAGK
jgi:hypothetical protein